MNHRGLLDESAFMAMLHTERHRYLNRDHAERTHCSWCWRAEHEGGTVRRGLGVLIGGCESVPSSQDSGTNSK